jgi:hypothetical protein
MAHLSPCCRQLIALLIENPPVPEAEINARLGIPIGSIGPNRGRCLDKLRDHPAIAALINAEGPGRTRPDGLASASGRAALGGYPASSASSGLEEQPDAQWR